MEQDIVLIVDAISPKTKQFTQRYLTHGAQAVFSDGDPAVLAEYLAQAKVLVTSTKGVSPEMLSRAPQCRYIQKYGAGTNNIAVAEASARAIPVGYVPGTNARSVAECTLTLLLAVYKQTVRGHNALVQEGRWLKTVLRDDNHELTGKTVGLVGFGNIGRHLRLLLGGFDCRVFYYDAYRLPPEQENGLAVGFLPLDELLGQCDVVSLHCPLTAETRHLLDRRRLALMKEGAVLLNCARGGIVDEAALFDALSSGHLLGAGIDTYESEPIDQHHPFCQLSNVVLSPHNGGGTVEAVEAVVRGAMANINALLETGQITHAETLVNAAELGL